MALSICNTVTDRHGREINHHGTAAFPIGCYFDHMPVEPVPWHWHDEVEAVIVWEGSCSFSVGAEKYHLKKGDGIFIHPGFLHAARETDHTDCFLHSICFHPRLVGGSLDSVFWQDYLIPLFSGPSCGCVSLAPDVDWQKEALNAIEAAWQLCSREGDGYEFLVRHALSKLICIMAGHCAFAQNVLSEKALRNAERIKIMLQYIHRHYSEEINTCQIAAIALISESECLRCFHDTIGTTPIQYLRQYRIRQACGLLASTPLKITDIGTQCGFQDISYFAKTFRGIVGCTPSQYRKNKAKEEQSAT